MNKLCKFLTVLMFVFLYAPMAIMIFFSFNADKSTFVFSGFSLRWYNELFSSSQTIIALKNTLILALLSAIIATVFGTLASIGIINIKGKLAKKTLSTVTNIPMMNPDVVTGVSLMLLFVFIGRILGFSSSLNFYTLLIAHITFNLPYVIINVMPKLKSVSGALQDASRDLGCSNFGSFFRVIFPNIYSGILSAFLMCFTLSLDDFVISYFTNGTGFQTLPLMIYSKTKKTIKPDMYALSSCIFVAILLLLITVNIIKIKSSNKSEIKKNSKFKKIALSVICLVLCVSIVGFSSMKTSINKYENLFSELEGDYPKTLQGTTLNVFNWGEYISDGSDDMLDVIDSFEKLTGIKVNYENFDSNETMYSKLSSGAVQYDVIIPSDYMIDRLRSEGLLKKLDYSKLTNYNYIDEKYKSLYFDEKNEYTVPYNVGYVGLIYNEKIVKEKVDSWDIMWDEKYTGNILTFNNSRDAFMIAQCLLGIDLNTTNLSDWDKAAELLKKQNSVLQARVMDAVFNKMEGGNAAIAPYYAGDYLTMAEINPDLKFVYPKEGTNVFVDAMCCPKNAQNFDAAMMFINYMLEPKVALANAEYIRYASPNTAVVESEEYSLKGNEYLYPKQKIKSEFYHNLDKKVRKYFEKLWEEVKRN